jgi:hypothetical protein
MRARDLFGVGIRLIGLWQITQACYYGFYGIWKFNGGMPASNVSLEIDAGMALFYLVLGLLLILLADSIVRAAYGGISTARDDDNP